MQNYELLYAFIFMFVWGVLNRFEELTNFESWWDKSIFKKLEKTHPKLYRWLRSYDKDELNYIKILGIKIKLHPIFKDGYHNAKNAIVLLFGVYMWILYGLPVAVAMMFVWWLAQMFGLTIFIKEKQ